MSTQLLTVSPSPHIHEKQHVKQLMYGVVIAMIPALLLGVYTFGFSVLKVTFIAVASCVLFEYLISTYLLKERTKVADGSAIITGILLAFNLPVSAPWWMIIIGSLVAMGIGKMAFGGLGNNPFNPALVGRVFLLISFPVEMTKWLIPTPGNFIQVDGATGATPLGFIKEGLKNGEALSDLLVSIPDTTSLLFGLQGGSLGEVSALALLIGLIYMLIKKIITWHIPVSIFMTILMFTGILWLVDPTLYLNPVFHLFTGGVMLGAIFMATDYVTSPMTHKGMIVFGIGIGVITVLIRLFGSYPEGISFAILIMNAFVPLINKYIKPHRFGR